MSDSRFDRPRRADTETPEPLPMRAELKVLRQPTLHDRQRAEAAREHSLRRCNEIRVQLFGKEPIK